MGSGIPKTLARKLARVKLFLCDVDGVLTDGMVLLGAGQEYKRFNIRDGLGLLILKRNGIKVGWISNRFSPVTQLRAEELKIDFLHQEDVDKVQIAEKILSQAGVTWEQVCYMGDDVVDLGMLKRAGVSIAVGDAIEEVKAAADYVTKAEGGRGAVREAIRLILSAQKKWDSIIKAYSA